MRIQFALLLSALLVSPLFAAAQLENLDAFGDMFDNQIPGIGNPIIFEVTPTTPRPNSTATVRAESFTLDLNRAQTRWSVDGVTVAQGTGITEIEIALGDIGSETTVQLRATEGSATYSNTRVIRPVVVDIIWQTDTYTPPLYKGKALPSSEAVVRVVAIPDIRIDGIRADPADLVYTWRAGNKTLGSQSGTGRSSIEIPAPKLFSKEAVFVTVETQRGDAQAIGFAEIRSVPPEIVLYEDDPLLGIRYEAALPSRYRLDNEEVRLVASPYHFSGRTRTNGGRTEFSWRINGSSVDNPLIDKSSIVLRQTGGAGDASIALIAQHTQNVLQRARETLTITFGDTNTGGASQQP